jgi:hypothetical protein
MTINPHLVNDGVPFISADILPASEVNNQSTNGLLAWLNGAGVLGPAVITNDASDYNLPAVTYNNQASTPVLVKCIYDATYGFNELTILPDGTTRLVTAATISSAGPHVFSEYYGRWYIFTNELSVTWYRTDDASMSNVTQYSMATTMTVLSVADTGLINVILAAGSNASGKGKIVKITGTALLDYYTHATYSAFTGVAAYYNVDTSQVCAVAVANNGIVYTIDGGATWSNATMPTLPALWNTEGLHIVHDVGFGYILSGCTTDGKAFFSISPTGASWGPVQLTPQCIWGTVTTTRLICGIAANGNALCCPYVSSISNGNVVTVGFMVSIDNGQSWYHTGRGARFTGLEQLRCAKVSDRIAVISNTNAVFSAPLVNYGTIS